MNVKIVLVASDSLKPMVDLVLKNHQDYCDRHGYTLVLHKWDLKDNNRYGLVAGELDGCDYVFSVGVDTLITNHNIRIESLVEPFKNYDLLITRDVNGINADNQIIKTTDQSKLFFNTLNAEMQIKDKWKDDQVCELALFNMFPTLKKFIMNQRNFNSYRYDKMYSRNHQQGQWQRGDFVLHVPGQTFGNKMAILQEHIDQVV